MNPDRFVHDRWLARRKERSVESLQAGLEVMRTRAHQLSEDKTMRPDFRTIAIGVYNTMIRRRVEYLRTRG